jgi:hypothetical protein
MTTITMRYIGEAFLITGKESAVAGHNFRHTSRALGATYGDPGIVDLDLVGGMRRDR